MAEKMVKIYGEASVGLGQRTYKYGDNDAVSWMDMFSNGKIGANMAATDGAWKVGATYVSEVNNTRDDGVDWTSSSTDPLKPIYNYIYLENDAIKAQLGKQIWALPSLSCNYCGDPTYVARPSYGWYGGQTFGVFIARGGHAATFRDDRLTVKVKSVGLTINLEIEQEGSLSLAPSNPTGDNYSRTGFGLMYVNKVGPVMLGFMYNSASRVANKNFDPDTEKTAKDGDSASLMALAVKYPINPGLSVTLNYHSSSYKPGTSGAKAATEAMTGLAVDFALDKTSGVSGAYDMSTYEDGNDANGTDKGQYTGLLVSYAKIIGGVKLNAGYESESTKTGDTKVTTSNLTFQASTRF
jgi:hypothetical protein